jgi:glycosyltransferase involved in cell wall biosynthesis
MRIVQMLSCGMNNGAARYCLALSVGLAERGHSVLLLHRKWLEPDAAVAAGVWCAETTFKRTPEELRRVASMLSAHGAQVVQSHMSSANAFGVVQRLLGGPPVVANAHARHIQLHWALNDLVIAPSETAADYHHAFNLVPRRKLMVIPSTLGAQVPPATTPERRAEARRRLGLADSSLVIGLVGDIVAEKRQSDLLLAARGLLERRPDAVVVLIGHEFSRREARRLQTASAGLENRIIRLNRRDDIADVLAGFDIFALPSVREEIPLVLVEAMAAGLAVVSTRVGRAPELIDDGRSGFLVDPRDTATMGERLETLAADPALRARFGEAARARMLAELAPGPIVERVEAALASVATGVRRPLRQARRRLTPGLSRPTPRAHEQP